MSTYCAEVLSPGLGSKAANDSGLSPATAGSRARPGVKVLLIRERAEGFVLSRLTDGGESAGDTQYDTLDEAMSQAYGEYDLSGWKFCPDDVDPLEYIRGRSGS
jgi:hypothetical protein